MSVSLAAENQNNLANHEPSAWRRDLTLPVGLELETDDSMQTYKHITIRKMTGKEEALLTDPKLKKNAGALITALLSSCVVSMEGLPKTDARIVRKMSSADRNFLLLELRRLTFGDEIETQYRCPSCGGENYQSENLSEVTIREFKDEGNGQEVSVTLADGFEGPDGEWHFDFAFRFPTGEDEEAASGRKDKNAVRQQDALLTRCLIRVGTLDERRVRGMGTHLLAALSMSDRRKIQTAMDDAAPGPDLIREISCDHCGHEFNSALDMRHFFPLG